MEISLPSLGLYLPNQTSRSEHLNEPSQESFLGVAVSCAGKAAVRAQAPRSCRAAFALPRRLTGRPPFPTGPVEIRCCTNPQQTTINLANVRCVCEEGMILPRQALENNVLISDGNLLFLTINWADTAALNYDPSSPFPGPRNEIGEPESFKEVTSKIQGI